MTPGAGTERPVRGIALGGVRGGAGKLRNCGGHPGDTSVAPTTRDVRPRNCGGPTGRARWCRRRCGATTRDNARRGAIYDTRCQHGTTRPRHCVGRCTRWCRKIAILRRSSGRHKCRPYVAVCSSAELRRSSGRHKCRPYVVGCSSTELRRTDGAGAVVPAALRRTTRDDARRGAIYDARCRNGTTRPWHCVGRCTRWCGATTRDDARRGAIYDARAGTERPVRGIALGGVRGGAGKLRYCGGHPGDTSVARMTRGVRPRNCGGPTGRHKCRPYVAGCSSAELRRSSGRHKCRPYGAGCSSAILRQAVAVNGRRFRRQGRS